MNKNIMDIEIKNIEDLPRDAQKELNDRMREVNSMVLRGMEDKLAKDEGINIEIREWKHGTR